MIALFTSKHKFKQKLQHSILETCAYQLRIYKSAISTSFVYLDLVKRRLMCIVLCPNSSLHCLFTCPLLYPVYFSPQNAWCYFEKKNWYRSCRSFHISCILSFRTVCRCLQQYLGSFFCHDITTFNAANSEMFRVNTFVNFLFSFIFRSF